MGKAVRSAHDWVKQNKIISTVGNALGGVLPIAGTIGQAAGALGYGRRRVRRVRRHVGGRRRVVRRRGRGWRDIASKVHGLVKSNKLVSKALDQFGHPKLAGVARTFGYGRRARGGAGYGSFFTTSQIAAPKW